MWRYWNSDCENKYVNSSYTFKGLIDLAELRNQRVNQNPLEMNDTINEVTQLTYNL